MPIALTLDVSDLEPGRYAVVCLSHDANYLTVSTGSELARKSWTVGR